MTLADPFSPSLSLCSARILLAGALLRPAAVARALRRLCASRRSRHRVRDVARSLSVPKPELNEPGWPFWLAPATPPPPSSRPAAPSAARPAPSHYRASAEPSAAPLCLEPRNQAEPSPSS